MIDDILHSVGEAEEQADQMLKNVKEECQRIKDEAVQEVENLWRKKKEEFQKDEEVQRISVRQEEEKAQVRSLLDRVSANMAAEAGCRHSGDKCGC